MSTCYEYIRKKTDEDKQLFKRLENYLKSVENNTTEKYHDEHGRKEKKIDEY